MHVRRLFTERTNALHETAQLRHKILKFQNRDKVLTSQNAKLQSVVSQQKNIIEKLKAQRKELLSFYKKHKKYQLREAQIENQKALLERIQSKFQEAERNEDEQSDIQSSPNFAFNHESDAYLRQEKGSDVLRNAAFFKDQQIMRLKKANDQNRLLIFMQEKLAEMKSKFMTQILIRVKPDPETNTDINNQELLQESFNVLNTEEMGLAKQLVINDNDQQIIAVADAITKASDTQAEFFDSTIAQKVQNVVLQDRSDYVIGIVGEQSSGKFFTLFGMPFNTQLCDFDYNSTSYDI